MILVDVNLLLYATNPVAPEHALAKPWLENTIAASERVGLAWTTILAFIRLSSSPIVARQTTAPADIWRYVQREWLSKPNVWVPEPGQSHDRILGFLFQNFATTHRKVSDAHLAAIAIEHGLTLYSADRDFASAPGLSWVNPLRQNSVNERAPLPWLRLRDQPGRWTGDPIQTAVYARPKTGKPSSRKPRR